MPPPHTSQERAVFSRRGSCSGQGQAQQVEAQTGGQNKGADCNGGAVWGLGFHLVCSLESSLQLNSSPQATAQPTSTRTAVSGDQGPKGSPRHPGFPCLPRLRTSDLAKRAFPHRGLASPSARLVIWGAHCPWTVRQEGDHSPPQLPPWPWFRQDPPMTLLVTCGPSLPPAPAGS